MQVAPHVCMLLIEIKLGESITNKNYFLILTSIFGPLTTQGFSNFSFVFSTQAASLSC